ncbi:MAG: zinc ribbon domain-containing protein [Bacillota bacterium]
MPIYEFKCSSCGEKFERLCRMGEDSPGPCPGCGSDASKKVLSLFAGKGSKGSACSGCSSSKCSSCH